MPAATSNLTILLTDIKGFTEKTSHKSRADILALLDKHKELVLPVLTARGGRLVKTIGDAFLMAFESPTDAVLAGVAVQDVLRSYNEDKPEADRIEVRVAINSGEVTLADNDVFGDPVNIAARIEGVAEAGEVFFTEAVYLAMNKNEVPSSEIGLLQLKGIPEKIRVYKVRRERPVGEGSAREIPTAISRPPTAAPPPKAAAVVPAVRPAIFRRLAALLIDVCLCGVIVNCLFSREKVDVNYHRSAAAPATGNEKVQLDGKGLKVDNGEAQVEIGPGGISVHDGSKDKTVFENGHWTVTKSKFSHDWHFALVWYLYCLIFLKRLGTTPGGRIGRLSVVRMDGSPLEKRDYFYRIAFSLLSMYCLGLGFLWALWERDGRGWHDLVAGTRVVETPS